MSMRQGSPGGRRPRGRHGNNGERSGGGAPPAMRGDQRPRSASSLRHQTFDSNGPDVRVRGNAWQVHEKYQSLARDAQSSGDRVLAENYLQYAEHYFRIIEAINDATAAEQRQRGFTPATPFGAQPEIPANYYTPDGQLAGAPAAPQGGPPVGEPTVTAEPAQAQVERKTPAVVQPLTPLFSDEPEDVDGSSPQQLVAGR